MTNNTHTLDDYLLPNASTMNEFSDDGMIVDIDGEPEVRALHPYDAAPEAASVWMENASETLISA